VRTYSLVGLVLLTTLSIVWACSSEPPPSEPPAKTVEQPKAPVEPVEPAQPEQVQPEQPPVAELPPLDNTCTSDNDCIPAPSCCSKPCTPVVINRSAMPEARRRLEETCPEKTQCGSAGGCRTHEYLCVDGTCALVFHDDPRFRKRRDQ
jgi:hypothetical protein